MLKMLSKVLVTCCLLSLFAFSAQAVERPLPDEAQEARAEALFHEIRCVACQSESLADSPADVASDIRQAIRVRIAAGDSTDQVKEYLIRRYGDAVMMRPPLTEKTALLWFGPTVLLIIAILVIWIGVKLESARSRK